MSSKFQNDAIFWVEVEKINPNPYQPRRDFNEERLRDLAESIRQYGVLQPLTVTRKEQAKDDGGIKVEYELIAGERRHRASKIAGLSQVPVIIRSAEENNQVKLELAIIENLQREDLNPIERAEAFDQLATKFDFTHREIAEKIGKSREYVSNSMRLLKLPDKIKNAIISGKMTEGHARPIMMLRDKPEEQETLFKEVIHKKLTVREAESIARRSAQDKVRKKKNKVDPQIKALEERLSETFGTRVKIEEREVGGKLVIDYFSSEDLEAIIELVQASGDVEMGDMMEQYVEAMSQRTENTESQLEEQQRETLGSMIAAAREEQQAEQAPEETEPQADEVKENTPPPRTSEPMEPMADEDTLEETFVSTESQGASDSADRDEAVIEQEEQVDTLESQQDPEPKQEEGENTIEEQDKETETGEEEDDIYAISNFSI